MGPKLTQKQMKRKLKKEQEEAKLTERLAAKEKNKAMEQSKKDKRQQQLKNMQECILTATESEVSNTDTVLTTMPAANSSLPATVKKPLRSADLSKPALSTNASSNLQTTARTSAPVPVPTSSLNPIQTPVSFSSLPYAMTSFPRTSLRWVQPQTVPLSLVPLRTFRGDRAPFRTGQLPVTQFLAIPLSAVPYTAMYNSVTQYSVQQYLSAQYAAVSQLLSSQYSRPQHQAPQYQTAPIKVASNSTIRNVEIPYTTTPFSNRILSTEASFSPEYRLENAYFKETELPTNRVNDSRQPYSMHQIEDIQFRPFRISPRVITPRVETAVRALEKPSTFRVPRKTTSVSTSPISESKPSKAQQSPMSSSKMVAFDVPTLPTEKDSINIPQLPQNSLRGLSLKKLLLPTSRLEDILQEPQSPAPYVEELRFKPSHLATSSVDDTQLTKNPSSRPHLPMPSPGEHHRVVHKSEITENWKLSKVPSIINYCEFPKTTRRCTENIPTNIYYNLNESTEANVISNKLHDNIMTNAAKSSSKSIINYCEKPSYRRTESTIHDDVKANAAKSSLRSVFYYSEFSKPNHRRTENTPISIYYNSEHKNVEGNANLTKFHDDNMINTTKLAFKSAFNYREFQKPSCRRTENTLTDFYYGSEEENIEVKENLNKFYDAKMTNTAMPSLKSIFNYGEFQKPSYRITENTPTSIYYNSVEKNTEPNVISNKLHNNIMTNAAKSSSKSIINYCEKPSYRHTESTPTSIYYSSEKKNTEANVVSNKLRDDGMANITKLSLKSSFNYCEFQKPNHKSTGNILTGNYYSSEEKSTEINADSNKLYDDDIANTTKSSLKPIFNYSEFSKPTQTCTENIPTSIYYGLEKKNTEANIVSNKLHDDNMANITKSLLKSSFNYCEFQKPGYRSTENTLTGNYYSSEGKSTKVNADSNKLRDDDIANNTKWSLKPTFNYREFSPTQRCTENTPTSIYYGLEEKNTEANVVSNKLRNGSMANTTKSPLKSTFNYYEFQKPSYRSTENMLTGNYYTSAERCTEVNANSNKLHDDDMVNTTKSSLKSTFNYREFPKPTQRCTESTLTSIYYGSEEKNTEINAVSNKLHYKDVMANATKSSLKCNINYCEFPKPSYRRTENTPTDIYYDSEENNREFNIDSNKLYDDDMADIANSSLKYIFNYSEFQKPTHRHTENKSTGFYSHSSKLHNDDMKNAEKSTDSSQIYTNLFPPKSLTDMQKWHLDMLTVSYKDHKKYIGRTKQY